MTSVRVWPLQGIEPKAIEAVAHAASAVIPPRRNDWAESPFPAISPADPTIAARKKIGIKVVVYWKAMLVAGGKLQASNTLRGKAVARSNGHPLNSDRSPSGTVKHRRKKPQRGRKIAPQKAAGRKIGERRIFPAESPKSENRLD